MNRIEEEGSDLLAPLRDAAPAGQSKVDVLKAVHTGRRQSRRRLVAGMVAAASLVVVAGVGVPMLVHNLPDAIGPARPGEQSFDIFQQAVSVGSAGGFTPESFETAGDQQVITLVKENYSGGTAKITVFTPATSPAYRVDNDTRAPDVNGQEAHWVDSGKALAWRWADDAWATVTWKNSPEADIKDKIHRVAQSVLPEKAPVKVPFTMARNDALQLTSIQVGTKSAETMAVFTYASPQDGPLTVSVGLRRMPTDSPTTTVNGHPATAHSNGVQILDTGHNLAAYAVSDGKNGAPELLKEVAGSIQAVPDPDDRSTWSPTLWR